MMPAVASGVASVLSVRSDAMMALRSASDWIRRRDSREASDRSRRANQSVRPAAMSPSKPPPAAVVTPKR